MFNLVLRVRGLNWEDELMKKRMRVCILIFTLCVFYSSIPNTVLGQGASLAQQVFNKHRETLQREDIQGSLLQVLEGLKAPNVQALLNPQTIPLVVANPDLLPQFAPDIDPQFVTLLKVDAELQGLFNDPQMQKLLQDPASIDELIGLLVDIGARKPNMVAPEDAFLESAIEPSTERPGLVRALAFSADGQILASGGRDTFVHLRIPTTGEIRLRGHTRTVTSVAFSPDGRRLASSSVDGSVRLWNPQTGRSLRAIPNAHPGGVQSVAFSADGRLLASGGRDNTVCLWDPQTGRLIRRLRGHRDWVLGVAFSGEGFLASASRDRTVRLWRSNGQRLRSLRGHTDFVTSVAFAATGELVSGSRDATVRSWNPQTGRALRVFRGHTDFVNSVAVSANATIASASSDLTVRLWDLKTGESLRVFLDATEIVRVVAFSPNGQLLVAGDESGKVFSWEQGA